MESAMPIIMVVVKVLLVIVAILTFVAYLTLIERKVLGWIQVRIGPNRVGPWGLLQPLADGAKLLLKEEITVAGANKEVYILAPLIVVVCAIVPFAVIPFAKGLGLETLLGPTVSQYDLNTGVIADLNVGILFIFGISSLGVYGVILGGWASNSKYSLLGSIRAAAQMISYELGLSLSVIGVLLLAGTLNLVQIVENQDSIWKWYVFRQPLGFLLFLIAGSAEIARTPFDLMECENELVAGYQTEYSSMKFGLFYLGEYAHLLFLSALTTTLFFGGWQGPFLPPIIWFLAKMFFFVFVFVWIRGTYPRLRYDRVMAFGWKTLVPVGLFNVMATAFIYAIYLQYWGA
ncbi:MAG: NADH-quinone oxidoreductase subunit NuoH [Syntrophaceae bacterium]|nr:NADH-quinone oxidoreductase subunit NuoH [Syntrophaceae bacterium]